MNLICKEWQVYLRDGRVSLMLLSLGGLFLAAALMTGIQQAEYRSASAESARAEYARWLAQPAKFAHAAAHYGMWAFKTPTALSAADPGINAFVGSAVWMEAHLQNEALYRPAQDAGVSERFGALSPTVVISVFAPLLLLLMGFGSVAREREQGTWALSLVQARDVRKILFAKSGALAVLATLALIPGLIAIGYFMLSSGAVDADAWQRAAVWVVSASLYMAIVASLVVLASAHIRTSARVLGIGLAAWLLMMVLVPRLANGLAAGVAPLPTQQGFSRDMKSALAVPDTDGNQRIKSLQQELMAKTGESEVSQLPVNFTGVRLQAGEDHGDKVFDEFWSSQFNGIDRQRKLVRWAGLLSPVIAFGALSQSVTGNDFTQHRDFIVQVEAHRRLIQRAMNDEIMANPELTGTRHLSDASLWSKVPAFQFQLPPLVQLVASWLPQLLLLGAWLAAAILLLARCARIEARRDT